MSISRTHTQCSGTTSLTAPRQNKMQIPKHLAHNPQWRKPQLTALEVKTNDKHPSKCTKLTSTSRQLLNLQMDLYPLNTKSTTVQPVKILKSPSKTCPRAMQTNSKLSKLQPSSKHSSVIDSQTATPTSSTSSKITKTTTLTAKLLWTPLRLLEASRML